MDWAKLSRREKQHLFVLRKRIRWLNERIHQNGGIRVSHDRKEMNALRWAIATLVPEFEIDREPAADLSYDEFTDLEILN